MKTLQQKRRGNLSYWIGFDERDPETCYVAEAKVKTPGAVMHLVWRYACRPDPEQLRADALEHGVRSPRPYQPGQPCDGSIGACAHALFVHFCQARELNPAALYARAYPEREPPDFEPMREEAEWEGVAYPKRWDAEATAKLAESLHAINAHALAEVVEDATFAPAGTTASLFT